MMITYQSERVFKPRKLSRQTEADVAVHPSECQNPLRIHVVYLLERNIILIIAHRFVRILALLCFFKITD